MIQKPLTIIIFGATGDLFKRKLAQALFDLHKEKLLPEGTSIFGLSRKDLGEEEFRESVASYVKTEDKESLDVFLKSIFYRQGDILEPKAYENLKQDLVLRDEFLGQCSNKLFYLAVVPDLYEKVFRNLSASGLTIPCAPEFGSDKDAWIRVLVEKPFGQNPVHAEMLDLLLGKLFFEDQIFRIDHYLAKETIQDILAFRFANCLFESLWSRNHIESIFVKSYEKDDVKGRGAFYDKVGALKDVGQNHLLQMLALVGAEKPASLKAEDIRIARANFFKDVSLDSDKCECIRGQYEGYSEELGVREGSETETYFKLKLKIKSERWKGVPFYVEHGKALSETSAEIIVKFKSDCDDAESLFPETKNTLIFHIQPKEGISIEFMLKNSDSGFGLQKKVLSFDYSEDASPFVYPYKKLLSDAISGDQTLFVSTDEIKEEWRIVGDIMKVFENVPLKIYEKGSNPEEI